VTNLLKKRSLVQEAAALRAGTDDPVDAVHRTCDRIDAVDPEVRAFVAETGRRTRLLKAARRAAAAVRDPVGRPVLHGVPVGIKDIVRVDGLPTRAGSALPPEVLGGRQAGVVDRLCAAGALIAGKTVTAEFAVTAPGPTRNPHNPAHTPGGSSSGSAAAVAGRTGGRGAGRAGWRGRCRGGRRPALPAGDRAGPGRPRPQSVRPRASTSIVRWISASSSVR